MSEHRRPCGGYGQGYYCLTCGKDGISMMGHSKRDACVPNLKLVKQLRAANPPPGTKPRYIRPGIIEENK